MVATVETISEPELHSKRCGASISSAPSVVKKSSSMNSGRGIWSTLIHREVAEVNGGPTILTDQRFGSSDDLFIARWAQRTPLLRPQPELQLGSRPMDLVFDYFQ